MKISNPYNGITSKIRKRVISHEHVTRQQTLQNVINRGIDVLGISNYTPAVPPMPIDGWNRQFIDWQIKLDGQGNVVYETDGQGNIKTKTVGGITYKVPVLERVTKTYSGGYVDFEKANGQMSDLANMPQLPNGEHTHYTWPEGSGLTSTKHINFLGSLWPDAGNGSGSVDGLTEYNQENGYNVTPSGLHGIFELWSLEEIFNNVRANLLFPGKVFGTLNHPGFSGMEDRYIRAYMTMAGDLFKGMEIWNNSDTVTESAQNRVYYDRALNMGYRLWCCAVNDWGKFREGAVAMLDNEGCNMVYLDASWENKTPIQQAEMTLDALIAGSFSAVGLGTLDISSVKVGNDCVQVTFNETPDSTIIDIDGVRTNGGSQRTLFATVRSTNKFVRFEAFKGDDFIFTQPFFIDNDFSIKQLSAVLFSD